jgi:hypothetical protein
LAVVLTDRRLPQVVMMPEPCSKQKNPSQNLEILREARKQISLKANKKIECLHRKIERKNAAVFQLLRNA